MTVYNSGMSDKWRIDELSELAGMALDAAPYEGQRSRRVRDVPDVRTIRYYTTLGLLDRPLEMQGRTAFYGRRHLLQLVAIKRLQSQGLPLVEVQKTLAGADDKRLAKWADLPSGFVDQATKSRFAEPEPLARGASRPSDPIDGASERGATRPRDFWLQLPKPAADGETPPVPPALEAKRALVLAIDAGVSLVIEGVEASDVDERSLAMLQPAVAMLRESLAASGMRPDGGGADVGRDEDECKQ